MMTLNAYTSTRGWLTREALGIPVDWHVAIIAVNAQMARRSRRWITLYDLRAFDPNQGAYVRRRRNGYNPIILASRLSGHGPPQWMRRACEQLNGPTVAQVNDRSGAFPQPPDTPLSEYLAGVDALLAAMAAADVECR